METQGVGKVVKLAAPPQVFWGQGGARWLLSQG